MTVTTWVVLCYAADGRPIPRYLRGDELIVDQPTGALRVMLGAQLVGSVAAGRWSTFAEWITPEFTTDFDTAFGSQLDASLDQPTIPPPRSAAMPVPPTRRTASMTPPSQPTR